MGIFFHISVIIQHLPWCHIGLGILYLVFLVLIGLVFLLVMEKVLWILVPSTFPPIHFIVGLIVVIFCHLRVVIIHP